jgi:hypothetical protein
MLYARSAGIEVALTLCLRLALHGLERESLARDYPSADGRSKVIARLPAFSPSIGY